MNAKNWKKQFCKYDPPLQVRLAELIEYGRNVPTPSNICWRDEWDTKEEWRLNPYSLTQTKTEKDGQEGHARNMRIESR